MFKRLNRSEHEKVEELLSPYIDGELSIEEATLVERHLRDCRACSQNLETLRQTVNLVRQLPAVSPPRSFTISHLVVPERPWRWGYVYLRGATALAALLLIALLAGDLGFQYLWAPRMAAPAPQPMMIEATVEVPEAIVETAEAEPGALGEAPPTIEQMEVQKVEETPPVEAAPPIERLGTPLPSPEPSPTPELVEAVKSPLPLRGPEELASETAERFFALLPTLRLLERVLFGAFLILGGATVLVRWRQMVGQ